MKRVSILILAVLLVCSMAFSVSAAQSAFTKITVSAAYPIVTNAPDDPGKKPAGFVDGYGIGNTAKDDVAAFTDLDFGDTGASTATMGFAFGTEGGSSTLLMYLDDLNSTPIATFVTTYSGGWGTANIKDYTQNVKIPKGKHTVYVKWTNATGSLHTLVFGAGTATAAATTAAPAASTTTKAAAPAASTATKTTTASTTAPKAADMGMVTSIFALAMSGAAVFGLKKKH